MRRITAASTVGLYSLLVALALAGPVRAQSTPEAAKPKPAIQVLNAALRHWAELIEPAEGRSTKTLVTRVKVTRAEGLPGVLAGLEADIAFQAPDRLRLTVTAGPETYAAGRVGDMLWVHVPGKKFGLIGTPDVPRFAGFPQEADKEAPLPPFKLPITRKQLALVPLLVHAKHLEPREFEGHACHVLSLALFPKAAALLGAGGENAKAELWVRQADLLPARLSFSDGKKIDATVDFVGARIEERIPDAQDPIWWAITPNKGDKIEEVAASHLAKFFKVASSGFSETIPTLGPATGKREIVATSGKGRLENIDGTRVLFLKGSPTEMGTQHGELLKEEIRGVMDKILYGVGVGSSFGTGKWFFGEIEDAQARVEKFTDPRYLEEMDALAAAIGAHSQEARLANFFPELFHCSGFAIFGKATEGGRMYHGRVLDYMKGVGLEQNAVLIVHQPDYGHAWVNASYAGFVGSVTAMNEKGIAIGEMGGGGYGDWDGKPMAQLLREIMEKADTLDEAVEIMRKGPRTCEYYYVISSGKEMKAVGIAATPTLFETIDPGQAHPKLQHPIEDVVLMSAGDRYEELARRVKAQYGKFDEEAARDLMTRPVCMTSNIQSVLFAPDTLDLWVANADSKNVASHTRYTKYNLADLLKSAPPAEAASR